MEYVSLYRKYRPKNFDEVVGQDSITKTLINQIKSGNISHAYLFTGTRGTGKTSVAKIFAKAINCENNLNGNSCEKCESCKNLNNPNCLDIVEIDAASNTGVDNIRDLRDSVKYPPIIGKYKVYIIDEVHMLSDSAFNALLKTLEEPPAYVVFILATTEVHKLLPTILSRCIRLDFKLIPNTKLVQLLSKILDDKKVKYEHSALNLIASLGEGSARDTLSIADKCLAFSNNNLTYNSVVEATGTTDKSTLFELSNAILHNNPNDIFNIIEKVFEAGKNLSQLNKDLLIYLKDITIIKTCKNFKEIIDYPEDILEKMQDLANVTNSSNLLKIMQKLSGLEQDFRFTNNPKALFEIVLLGLLDEVSEIDNLKSQIEALSKQIQSNTVIP